MKYGRLFLGLAITLFSLWIIIGEQISGASSDATINARLVTLRSPISGVVKMPDRHLGAFIEKNEQVLNITGSIPDDMRLNDLRMERAFVQAEIERLLSFGAIEDPREISSIANFDEEVKANQSSKMSDRLLPGELGVYLVQARSRLEALNSGITVASKNLMLASSSAVYSPTNTILWELLVENGEFVERGAELAKLMICNSALVTLSVNSKIYNSLVVGQKAKFRINNVNKTYEGEVTRLAGSGAATIYRNLAISPSQQHLENFDVALFVPGLKDDVELQCLAGQRGRVFFDNRPLDWLRRFFW